MLLFLSRSLRLRRQTITDTGHNHRLETALARQRNRVGQQVRPQVQTVMVGWAHE
jgi:hypothetical protein